MHPINNKYFGNSAGSIEVLFNNGNSVVTGYMVKQPSYTKWLCTEDGVDTFLCELEANATPKAGQFTIKAYPLTAGVPSNSVLYVGRIDSNHVTCSDGKQYIWSVDAESPPIGSGYVLLATQYYG